MINQAAVFESLFLETEVQVVFYFERLQFNIYDSFSSGLHVLDALKRSFEFNCKKYILFDALIQTL